METLLKINLPEVENVFHQGQNFVNENISSVTNSVKHIGNTWKHTTTQATDKVIDQVSTTLEQTLEAAGDMQNQTSNMIQTAISASMGDWLTEHPGILQLLQILGWSVNHPIVSLIIIIFAISILWSIIKNIVRLIETASWSILQAPVKIILAALKLSWKSWTQVIIPGIKKLKKSPTSQPLLALPPANYQMVSVSKQQRLADISARLEALQKEQQQLIQEANTILKSADIHIT